MLRPLLLSLALLAGAAFAIAEPAHAGGHVSVGVGFGGHARPAPVYVAPAGTWVWQVERVWVPERVIGYDWYGHAIVEPGYWTTHRTRVWVPAAPAYRAHVVHHHRPHVAPYRVRAGVRFGW